MVKFADEELLRMLAKNSKAKLKELGVKFNVTEVAISKRVKKLEENGTIRRFTIDIDPKKLGYEITAFIGLDAEPEKNIAVQEKLKEMKEVRSLYITSIDHDFLTECWFKSNDDYTKFVRKLENINGVTRVCPATIYQKIK
ncbi:MAG: Lrp/AsnC family transcriptional regulator [Candidatus Hodarchaeales archaeon]